ncbi:flavin reductase family protein [Actinocorallia sp. A-T 12471]|uniref:flavin reductase family protein n=1 Tax=Actinocorallia sp. A-T 12471 TaxID=3089813 RepID=UPI0029D39544|nr:flavin reductase family protein [Actinocorallia sp. A-T 12471]MDX6741613.1 flavin reductase family protein [Actinocorallia sp. A-T 12471]
MIPSALADPRTLRRAFGAFATGVTVITTGGKTPHGMTANSFASVSLDPPLVLVCIGRDAIMHHCLDASFGVSVLAAGQEALARHFADRRRPLGAAQFEGIGHRLGTRTGVPLLGGAVAHFECELWRTYDGGDHTIFLGRVLDLARSEDGDALVFVDGGFRSAA